MNSLGFWGFFFLSHFLCDVIILEGFHGLGLNRDVQTSCFLPGTVTSLPFVTVSSSPSTDKYFFGGQRSGILCM